MLPRNRMLRAGLMTMLFPVAFLMGCDDDGGPDSTPPPTPSGVFSVTDDGAVDLYWNPIMGLDDVAGYGVYRSAASAGPYVKLATLDGASNDYYRDENVSNGQTWYYAVDAFDFDGNESALSVEDVWDTPRPSRAGMRVYSSDFDLARSAVDFSEQPSFGDMLVAPTDPGADLYVFRGTDGFLRVVGTVHAGPDTNFVQDFGGTERWNDVGWAPDAGWHVRSPLGYELAVGHTYLVWTWDNHFAKFRVTNVQSNYVDIDWAYQTAEGNPQLIRPRSTASTQGPAGGRS